MTDRRSFLKTAAALTAGAAVSPSILASDKFLGAPSVAPAAKKEIGLQTYSLGMDLLKDLPGGLSRLAKAGYTQLELFGYNEKEQGFTAGGRNGAITVSAKDYKKAAADAGIKITGSHINPTVRDYTKENFAKFDEFWKKAADLHAELGVTSMVQPSLPRIQNEDDAKMVSEIFNRAGDIASKAGLLWGYHNHSGEFQRVPKAGEQPQPQGQGFRRPSGEFIEKLLIENTDPSKVFFELDVYWTVMGQQDPVAWINNYANRIKLLHIKDVWIINDSGMMNFPNIFAAGYKAGILGFYVEVENGPVGGDQFQAVITSGEFLKNASFVK